jgi:hypothetical protein
VDADLWAAPRPFVWNNIDVGGRMAVVRLADGRLWVHSPVQLDDSLRLMLSSLGPVSPAHNGMNLYTSPARIASPTDIQVHANTRGLTHTGRVHRLTKVRTSWVCRTLIRTQLRLTQRGQLRTCEVREAMEARVPRSARTGMSRLEGERTQYTV